MANLWFAVRVADVIRTCIGCRGRVLATELVRLHLDPATELIEVDVSAGPGRGAWLHRRESCVSTALKRRAITRALRLTPDRQPESARLSPAAYAFLGDEG